MENTATCISIIIYYFEARDQLKVTLDSFTYQGYGKDIEVIIVDDGSIQQKTEIDSSQYAFHVNTIYLNPEKKWYTNPCVPFNIGFNAASANVILFQNAECFHYDNIVKYVLPRIDDNSYFSFGCFSINKETSTSIQNKYSFKEIIEQIPFIDKPRTADSEEGWLNHSIYLPIALNFCSAITKSNIIKLGGFDERYASGIGFEDNQILHEIELLKLKIKIVDDCIVVHQWQNTGFNINKKYKQLLFRNEQLYKLVSVGGFPYFLFNFIFVVSSFFGVEYKLFKLVNFTRRKRIALYRHSRNLINRVKEFVILFIYKKILPKPQWQNLPIFINNRNRLTTTKKMIEWLLRIGCRNITIIDNDSTYLPLLEYYKELTNIKSVKVIFLSKNVGAYALWDTYIFKTIGDRYYVYTDSDLEPMVGCPDDFLEYFLVKLRNTPKIQKIGFGLHLNDIPDTFEKKRKVIQTEEAYWKKPDNTGLFFTAPIDTTFALYAPFQKGGPRLKAMRSNYPYVLHHIPWYVDKNNIDEEELFYQKNANSFSSSNVNFSIYN